MGSMLAKLFSKWGARPQPRPSVPSVSSAPTESKKTPPPAPVDFASLAVYPLEERRAPSNAERDEGARLADQVRAHVAGAETPLPAFPGLASEVLALVKQSEPDLEKLVRVIRKDVGISSEVLRLANSAYYAGRAPIESVRDAVVRLGAQATAQTAAAAAVKVLFDPSAHASLEHHTSRWKRLYQHALLSSFGTAHLAMSLRKGDVERAFLGGLLHDVGKSLALSALCELELERQVTQINEWVVASSLEQLHLELGAAAAKAWGLPEAVVAICGEHHAQSFAPRHGVELQMVVAVSGLEEMRNDPMHREGLDAEVTSALSLLGMQKFQVRALITELTELSKRLKT